MLPFPQPLVISILVSVSMNFPVLGASYKLNHSICPLVTGIIYNVIKVHPCCSMYQNLFPFQGWIIFSYMCIPHFVYLFIHRGHLCCFHHLDNVNNAGVNISVQVSAWVLTCSTSGYIPWSEMVGSYNNSKFKFLRNH